MVIKKSKKVVGSFILSTALSIIMGGYFCDNVIATSAPGQQDPQASSESPYQVEAPQFQFNDYVLGYFDDIILGTFNLQPGEDAFTPSYIPQTESIHYHICTLPNSALNLALHGGSPISYQLQELINGEWIDKGQKKFPPSDLECDVAEGYEYRFKITNVSNQPLNGGYHFGDHNQHFPL